MPQKLKRLLTKLTRRSKVEEPVVKSPVEAIPDKIVEKVEEPIVKSPIEAVPDKAVEEVEEVIEKVKEPGAKKAESPVEAEKHTRGGRRRAPGGGGGGGMFEVNVSAGGLPEVVECSR